MLRSAYFETSICGERVEITYEFRIVGCPTGIDLGSTAPSTNPRPHRQVGNGCDVASPQSACLRTIATASDTITAMTGSDDESRVGVFLGRNFIGTLPRVSANALAPTIIDADDHDQRVTVTARIDLTGEACHVSIALP